MHVPASGSTAIAMTRGEAGIGRRKSLHATADAHFVLPIRGKGSSDWGYSWIPVVAPLVGAVLATLLFKSTDAADLIKAVKPS